MSRVFHWLGILLAGCLPVAAQEGYFPVDPVNLIRELLGTNTSFTATAEISGFSTNANEDFVLEAEYAMLAGQLRTVVNLAQLRGLNACETAQGQLHETGLDLVISLKLPGLKRAYTIYPRVHAYVETVLTWREHLKEIAELTKTKVRDTTLHGHPCEEYRVRAVTQIGDEFEILVWEAADLGNFPLQLRFETAASTFTIRFRNVSRTPPDIELFHPPGDYDRYPTLRDLTRALRGR